MNFKQALPVWAKGMQSEMNYTLGAYAAFGADDDQPFLLRLAGASVYRVFLNGSPIAYGPARGPMGFFRVDELALPVQPGLNHVAIEVTAYNVPAYCTCDDAPFIQAEVLTLGEVVLATGYSFALFELGERIRKVQRYTFQRPAIEAYRLSPRYDSWRVGEACESASPAHAQVLPQPQLLPRGIAYNNFRKLPAKAYAGQGRIEALPRPSDVQRDRSLLLDAKGQRGFRMDELEYILSDELKTLRTTYENRDALPPERCAIPKDGFLLCDWGRNVTGMPGLTIVCEESARLTLVFDEVLVDGDISPTRACICPAIDLHLRPGRYTFEAREPYTYRYIKCVAREGAVMVSDFYTREYAFPYDITVTFDSGNKKLDAVFRAAVETFRQNASDVYMDCPSRERAGWLCDSFFTARVEHALTGKSAIERNFLENFLLPDAYPDLPEGMLPMCYPSAHPDGNFIPSWAMWLVLELEEYLARTGDRAMIDGMKRKIYALVDYFRPFENEHGLLEKLKGWVFVEWSKAADFTRDVNFPTNMVYAGMLDAAARLYDDAPLRAQASRLKKTIADFSFDGTFFRDHALRTSSGLSVQPGRTEVCQYYAFFFGIASPDSHPALAKTLLHDFGPQRKQTGAYPDIHPANAFIGNYLRLDILSRYGYGEKLLGEIEGYFYYMAERTGTLWENDTSTASCNHGFASHVLIWLMRHAS